MLIVLKFGGSSLKSAEKIDNAARIVAKLIEEGHKVVMVVSARGDTTDDLMRQATDLNVKPSLRELDALLSVGEQMSASIMAMCLEKIGVSAVSLCGWQAGMLTDKNHGNARILEINTQRIENELAKSKVVVVAGFQGINNDCDITTIGRGGSDTSAVALAASLKADKCYIYTDVDGVYSADPRIVPQAMQHKAVQYDEMLEMASMGAGVLHNRSVELAKNEGVVIKVLSSNNSKGGTEVKTVSLEGRKVTGVTVDMDTTLVEIKGIDICEFPNILRLLAQYGITSDMMTSIDERIGITVPQEKSDIIVELISEYYKNVERINVVGDSTVAKVSLIGCGLGGDPSIAARMLNAIENIGVRIKSVVAGEIKISVLVSEAYANEVVKSIHKEFFEK